MYNCYLSNDNLQSIYIYIDYEYTYSFIFYTLSSVLNLLLYKLIDICHIKSQLIYAFLLTNRIFKLVDVSVECTLLDPTWQAKLTVFQCELNIYHSI